MFPGPFQRHTLCTSIIKRELKGLHTPSHSVFFLCVNIVYPQFHLQTLKPSPGETQVNTDTKGEAWLKDNCDHWRSDDIPVAYLVDDVDSVVELLPLQDGVQVVQPVLQVLVSFAEGNDDGDFLQRLTVFGFEASARLHVGILLLYVLQVHRCVKLHPQRTHWGQETSVRHQIIRTLVCTSYSSITCQRIKL